MYLTIGETVGTPSALFPDAGLTWRYIPPPVDLEVWRRVPLTPDAPFTTVSHWYGDEWMEDEHGFYDNSKMAGFMSFVDLPRKTSVPLELSLLFGGDEEFGERELTERGWRVRHSEDAVPTPWAYHDYIGASAGEFSCVKPSCVRFQNAWISDRTVCYLAAGKPAIVQHTGPSHYLPDDDGLFRFHTCDEAVQLLEKVVESYPEQSNKARALAEEHFDASRVASTILEIAL